MCFLKLLIVFVWKSFFRFVLYYFPAFPLNRPGPIYGLISQDKIFVIAFSPFARFRPQKQLREVFYKKSIPKNFTKLTENNCARVPFFNKVAGLMPATLLKKRLWHKCFPVNPAKFLRTPILKNICERLLLRSVLRLEKKTNFTSVDITKTFDRMPR